MLSVATITLAQEEKNIWLHIKVLEDYSHFHKNSQIQIRYCCSVALTSFCDSSSLWSKVLKDIINMMEFYLQPPGINHEAKPQARPLFSPELKFKCLETTERQQHFPGILNSIAKLVTRAENPLNSLLYDAISCLN